MKGQVSDDRGLRHFWIAGWYLPPENPGCSEALRGRDCLFIMMPQLFTQLHVRGGDVFVVGDPNARVGDLPNVFNARPPNRPTVLL